jgi:pimeloyl-ACP methyl ester carboxylesterase
MALVLVDTPDDNVIFAKEVLRFYARLSGFTRVMQALAAFGLLRCLRQCFPALRAGLWFVKPSEYAAAADDLNSLQRAAAQQSASKPLGSLRTIVITHGRPFPGPFAVLEQDWDAGQRRLADLSTNSDLIVAQDSNHMIHLEQPEIVIDAIRRACSPAACGSAQVGVG